MIVLKQLIVFFIIISIGYYIGYKKIIDSNAAGKLSWLVVNIANPCLIISGSLDRTNTIGKREIILTAVVSIAVFVVLIALAESLVPLLRMEKDLRGIYKAMLVFSNIGFMGFPIIESMYGVQALMYGTVFLIPFNILIYTYGICTISSEDSGKMNLKLIINPGTIACVIALVIFGFDIEVHSVASQTITMLSGLTAPLSMLVIGTSLTQISFNVHMLKLNEILFCIIKMILIPLAGILIIKLFIDNSVLVGVSTIMLATPVGSMTPMLAKHYNGNYEEASKIVAVTTLASIATMPLIFLIV